MGGAGSARFGRRSLALRHGLDDLMPEALAIIPLLAAGGPLELAGATLGGIGVLGPFGTLLGGGTLLTTVSGLALSVGLSYAATLLTPKPSQPNQSTQTTANESTAPRVRGYGRVMLGGARIFWDNVYAYGASFRATAIAHCMGPIDAVETYYFDDLVGGFASALALDAALSVTYPLAGLSVVETMRGTGVQAASGTALSYISAWTSADTAKGLCYTVCIYHSVAQKDFLTNYKNGEPSLRIIARMSMVWDPRNGAQNPDDAWDNPTTWGYSDNPALCILDYLRHPDGRGKARSRIDVSTFIDFANLCDEAVPLKAGGTEPRYRIGGTYTLTDEPAGVMQRLLATCDGEIYRTAAGLIGIRGGKWIDPTLTFGGDSILAFSLTQGSGKMMAFNRTTITFTSPDHDFQLIEADPWVDVVSEGFLGSLATSLQLDMVPSASQSRRLAKINAAKANPDWKGQISLDISGLNAICERVITIAIPTDDLGLTETFLITTSSIAPDYTRVDLDVVSLSSAAYSWDAATEEGASPATLPTGATSPSIPVPSLTLSAVGASYGGITAQSVQIVAAAPSDTSLRLVVQWRIASTGAWAQITPDPGIWTVNTGVISDGQSYDVQALFVATSTLQSGWSAISTIAVVASGTVPPAPTGLSATASGSVVTLGATAPNSSAVSAIAFWCTAGTSFAGATKVSTIYCAPNQTVVATNSPGTGTWRYWATAENSFASDSTQTGPQTVTV